LSGVPVGDPVDQKDADQLDVDAEIARLSQLNI
jgi:hypothetical protein